MKRNIKSIVNAYESERRKWVAYRFGTKEFEQRSHGNASYDTDVNYVADDYFTPDTYETL